MKTGVVLADGGSVASATRHFERAAADGFDSAWLAQIFSFDALTLIGALGNSAPGLEIGTAVIPTYPRHPLMLASQALTTQALIGNRLILGIGLSHKIVIENLFGYSYDKPALHMKDYLEKLLPQLDGAGPTQVVDAQRPPVILAALAPAMLKLAGAVADGTVTWMTGPDTLEGHIIPSITRAAEEAGKSAPRIIANMPVMVTNDPDGARTRAGEIFAGYGMLPSYRAMLDKEGAAGPADVAIVGDEATVAKQIDRFRDIGTTDFVVVPYGTKEENARTFDVVLGR